MDKDHNLKEIVDNYMQGQCSREELEAAFKLFDDPYHHLALRPALYEQWNKQETEESKKLKKKERLSILNNLHNQIHISQERQARKITLSKLVLRSLKIAAILILGLFLGFLIQQYTGTETLYYTSIAPTGSISQIILPDNTIVFLNSGSKIKYSLNHNGQREVFLEGEAWFEVKKNEKKPFVVHTPYYNIKVLGTQFNIKAYETDEEIVTTLEEGSIEVISGGTIKMNQSQILNPRQQFTYNQVKKTFRIENVRPSLFTSWKENKLIFINMNLKELFVLLERKYGVEIEVSDNIILDYHYDGTIKNETIIEVLDLLRETLPITYKIEGQKIIIKNELKKERKNMRDN